MSAARFASLAPGLAFIALVLAFLEVAVDRNWVKAVLIPAPSDTAVVLWNIIWSGAFADPVGDTLGLLFAGYGIACVLGVVLGVLMGYFRGVYNLLEPLAEVLRTIPKPVLLPPLMLFLGLGFPMKIFIVALAGVFPVLINTMQAVRSIDPVLIDTARTFGRGTGAILWRVMLPASAPLILAGMRVSLGFALVLVILSEMLAGSGGLGQLLSDMQKTFLVRETFAWLTIIAVVGFALTAMFDWIERRIAFWSRSAVE
ncbi:MAG TPA: ABC transporter permease [Alphaproteobacteria bacterium]|jgi:ABC-type nitrate/sulfonate/bicarbonate transport system permease component